MVVCKEQRAAHLYERGLKPRDYILDSKSGADTPEEKTLSPLRLCGEFFSVAAPPRCVTWITRERKRYRQESLRTGQRRRTEKPATTVSSMCRTRKASLPGRGAPLHAGKLRSASAASR